MNPPLRLMVRKQAADGRRHCRARVSDRRVHAKGPCRRRVLHGRCSCAAPAAVLPALLLFHCLAPLLRPLPAVFVRPLAWLCWERLSPRTWSVRDGPVETAQGHPLICRFSRQVAAVSLACLPATPSSSPAAVAGGPCACFPVSVYLIAALLLSIKLSLPRFSV
jgi:hypothetical protein